ELSNADIDWMVTTGERQQLDEGAPLIVPGDILEGLYLVLEGQFAMSAPCSGREFAQLARGDILGAGWLFNTGTVSVISAKSKAIVLSIPKAALLKKLKADMSFASHFYRAIALIMSERIRQQFEAVSGKSELLRYQSGQMVKEALFVFGELHDSDMDWMLRAGQVERIPANSVLLHMGRPVDALYTVLDGQLTIATTDTPYDPFSGCSHALSTQSQAFSPLAFIARGGLPGIISFLDFKPLPVKIYATRESKVLSIPRQKMVIKLQEDLSFAARFYRVIATQTANLLASVTATECRSDSADSTSDDSALDDELDMETLQRASEGGKKFDWMLKRLRVEA
ncbi:MAG: cyclic nucleotide-binding domain-containing protein, partial [Cyanobacteria bacterium J06554_11]